MLITHFKLDVMKNLTIESAEKIRYKFIMWLTIAWAIQYMPFLYMPENLKLLFVPLQIISGFVFFVLILKLVGFQRMLKRNPAITSALSEEVNVLYHRKTLATAFYSVIFLLVLLSIITAVYPISGSMACKLVLFFGILIHNIAWLIYNRN